MFTHYWIRECFADYLWSAHEMLGGLVVSELQDFLSLSDKDWMMDVGDCRAIELLLDLTGNLDAHLDDPLPR